MFPQAEDSPLAQIHLEDLINEKVFNSLETSEQRELISFLSSSQSSSQSIPWSHILKCLPDYQVRFFSLSL